MADYTDPDIEVPGYVITDDDWNILVNNFKAGALAAFTTDGDIFIATGANAGERVAAFNASNQLKRTAGGLETDTSVAAAGDTLVAQDGTDWGVETAMSQAQAEAGTDQQVRGVTAERISQAITAIGVGSITLRGSNTTEATTTSVSTVDLMSVTVSIATNRPFWASAQLRKTSGAGAGGSIGLKINATQINVPNIWSSTDDANHSGFVKLEAIAAQSSYDQSGYMVGSEGGGAVTHWTLETAMPVATITAVVWQAAVGSASITMGIDSSHVYDGNIA